MPYLRLHIDMDKTSSFTEGDKFEALSYVLSDLGRKATDGSTYRLVKDSHGGRCGLYEIVERKPRKKGKK